VNDADRELRIGGQRESDPNETAAQEQAVRGSFFLAAGGAIRSVYRRKEGVAPMRLLEALADICRAESECLVGEVAGPASAPVGSQALEEGTFVIDFAASAECLDDAGGIREPFGAVAPLVVRRYRPPRMRRRSERP
jgi:hypothetical protein